jgi:diguanylate cyclase (GGDEF)-like protein
VLTVAEHLSLSVANLKLQETLRYLAIRDPFTGLFNQRFMEETLGREISRVYRKATPPGITMMDLDHFKHFNDTFGHVPGDVLLSAPGSQIRGQVRKEDVACRFGGEEFILILPDASLEVTCQRAEELRSLVHELPILHQGQT